MKHSRIILIAATVLLIACESGSGGEVKNYYKDGQLQESYQTDEDGKIQGRYVLYFENGEPYKEINFKDSLKQGKAFTYWPNGSVKAMEIYDKNVLVDTALYYYEEGGEKEIMIYDSEGRIRLARKFYPHGSTKSRTVYHVGSGKVIASKLFHANGIIDKDRSLYMNILYKDWTKAQFYPNLPGQWDCDSIIMRVLKDLNHYEGKPKNILRSEEFKSLDNIVFNVLDEDYHDGYHVNLLLEVYTSRDEEHKCWEFPIQGNKSYRLPDHNLLPIN